MNTPESGKSNRVVKIQDREFLIESNLDITPKPGPVDLTSVKETANRTKQRADKYSSHEIEGTFEVINTVRYKSSNYERNGIYLMIEA